MNCRRQSVSANTLPFAARSSDLPTVEPVPQPRTASLRKSSTPSEKTPERSESAASSTMTSDKVLGTRSKSIPKEIHELIPEQTSSRVSQKSPERTREITTARKNSKLLLILPASRGSVIYSDQSADKSEYVYPTRMKEPLPAWSWSVQDIASRKPSTSSKRKSGSLVQMNSDCGCQVSPSEQRTSMSSSCASNVTGTESEEAKTFYSSTDTTETMMNPSNFQSVPVQRHRESRSAMRLGKQKEKVATFDKNVERSNKKLKPPSDTTAIRDAPERDAIITDNARVLYKQNNLLVLNRELCLYPLALLAVLVTVAVLVMVLRPREKFSFLHDTRLAFETCTALSCIQDAAYFGHLLEWNVNPCDNFYRFVCSRWTSKFPVAGNNYPASTNDDYVAALEERIYSMITNRDQMLDKKTLAMRGLVDQCVTGNHTKETVWNPLLELMASLSLEGFPLTPPVRKDLSVWKMAAKLLRKTGVAAFFSVTVSSHPYNSKDIASVELPKALSSIEGIGIRDVIQMYTSATFASVKALKKDFIPPVHRLNVVRFATELERLYQLYSGDRSFQISKLAYISPANEFLREVFDGVPHSVFSQDSEVYIQSPYFFSNVVGLVQKTAPHTVMNFLGVRTMIQMSPFLPQSDLLDVYSSILYSAPRTSVPRWKLCVRTVEKAIPSLFLRSSLADIDQHGSAVRFTELVSEITQEFIRGTDNAAFFSDSSKAAIRSIINNTDFKVLSTSWIKDNDRFNDYVGAIPSLRSNGLDSYLAAHERSFLAGLTRSSSERWSQSTFSTTCWSERGPRTIYIPMLVFNVTLAFAKDINAFQLSRAGVRIGRCIFDMLLSEINSADPSQQWLDEDARSKLAALQRCVGEPEDLYRMTRLRDAWAAHYAYRLFQKTARSRDRPLGLRVAPNKDVGARQLFFVYLVLQSCEQKADPNEYATSDDDAHWNAALRHDGGFHDAFRCAPGSSMYPEEQCELF